MTGRQKNLLEVNIAVFLWGGTALFPKLIHLPVGHMIMLRSIVAALVLIPFIKIIGGSLTIRERKDILPLVGISILMGLHWLTYFKSITVSTVAIGIIATQTYPIMTTLIEPLFFKERIRFADILLALLVLSGVVVLIPKFTTGSSVFLGVMWGLISAFFFSMRNILSRVYIQKYSGSFLMFIQVAVIGLLLAPVLKFDPQPINPYTWLLIIVLGIFFTAIPHTLHTYSFENLSARTISIIGSLNPIYGIIAAALFLHEIPSFRTVMGGLIVLSVVVIETLRTMRQAPVLAEA